MSDTSNAAPRFRSIGGTAFLVLFFIPAALTYFYKGALVLEEAADLLDGPELIWVTCYFLMLLVCAIRAFFVHRWWLPLLPVVAATADLLTHASEIPSILFFESIGPIVPSLAHIVALLVGLAPASSRYQREVEVLVDELIELAPSLRHADEAEQTLQRAGEYAAEDETRDKWHVSKWLIDARKAASQQLLAVEACLKRARRLKQLLSVDEDLPPRLSDTYRRVFESTTDLAITDLIDRLEANLNAWRPVSDKVRRMAMPNVFMTEAFFRVSERRGIQIASMVTAGLVVFGALHMRSYYQAAAEINVRSYWTLDDLIIQGMLVVPFALIALILMELFFRGMFRYFERDRRTVGSLRTYRWLLGHPGAVAILLLILMGGFVERAGDVMGELKRDEFNDWSLSKSESATVLDGSVLEHVFLVGTTSRTAIFRRVKEWSNADSESARPQDSDVIVMDRALVVCHARGEICSKLPMRGTTTAGESDETVMRIEERLTSLDNSVDSGFRKVVQDVKELDENIGLGFQSVDAEFDEVCKHLDRHQSQIMQGVDDALRSLVPGRESSDGNVSEVSDKTVPKPHRDPCRTGSNDSHEFGATTDIQGNRDAYKVNSAFDI